jgi:hypothetical protein
MLNKKQDKKKTIPRLNVEISTTQERRLDKLIPWGMRKPVMSSVLDWLLDSIESDPDLVINAIIAKTIKIKFEVANGFKEDKEEHTITG